MVFWYVGGGQRVNGDVNCIENAMIYRLVTFIGKLSLSCIGGNWRLLWKSVWVF